MPTKIIQSEISKNLDKALKDLNSKEGRVGWYSSNRYPKKKKPLVSYIASIQEYGYPAKGIPARSFMRSTAANKKSEWDSLTQRLSKLILQGKISAQQALEKLGEQIKGDIRDKIRAIQTPPLKRGTVLARIRSYKSYETAGKKSRKKQREAGLSNPTLIKPLVQTGILIQSLSSEVINK